jgi:hypothetical protein
MGLDYYDIMIKSEVSNDNVSKTRIACVDQ